jgi:hypothetical protein
MKTLKISTLLALCLLFATTSFAQVRLGVTAGGNFSTLYQKDVENDLHVGLRGGLTLDLGIAKFFSIVPEVNFSQMGWKFTPKEGESGVTQTGRLNYVEVPLNLVFKLKMGANARFLLFAGAYGAYAISGNVKVDSQTTKMTFGKNQGEVNPLEIGVDFGLGFQVKSFFMKLQYLGGVTSMSNTKNEDVSNTAFALSLGFFIF